MKAEIKGLHSSDIYDLEHFKPIDKNHFCFYLEMLVGVKNEKGAEQFGITVCTPQWLIDNKNEKDIFFGKNYLIVFEYNYKKLYAFLNNYIENLQGDSWVKLAEKVGRIAYWEFEDYQEY